MNNPIPNFWDLEWECKKIPNFWDQEWECKTVFLTQLGKDLTKEYRENVGNRNLLMPVTQVWERL